MLTALETLPLPELQWRLGRCRAMLTELLPLDGTGGPQPGGLLVTSRLNIYYFTGTLGSGLLWIPLDGEPVLMVRKGRERARLESPLPHVASFVSYKDVANLCLEAGSPLTEAAAVEMGGLTWAAADMMRERLPHVRFTSGDGIIHRCRMIKSAWELRKLELCGERHDRCLCRLLPERLAPGMTEREIGVAAWDVFLAHGHGGLIRLNGQGDETFLGNVSAGVSGLYPTSFDGPLGVRGQHPALPYLGDAGTVWKRGEVLTLDIGFTLEGYNTDKTQVFWAGPTPVPGDVAEAQAVCVDVQATAARLLRPGVKPSDIWRTVLEQVAATPFADGFMGLGPDQVRFLGHGIGLNVAEQPVIAARFDDPLEANMVLALEPKIALPGVGMVGLENTFAVTPDGGVSLTGNSHDIILVD